ncbi:hypothetical protein ACFLS9_01245 [Bacteroidota bacterium]
MTLNEIQVVISLLAAPRTQQQVLLVLETLISSGEYNAARFLSEMLMYSNQSEKFKKSVEDIINRIPIANKSKVIECTE